MNIASKVKYNKKFKDNEKPTEDAIIAIRPVSIDHFIDKKKVESISRKVYCSHFEYIFDQNKYIFRNINWNFLNMINTNLNFSNIIMKNGLYCSFSFEHLRWHYRCLVNTFNMSNNIRPIHSIKRYPIKNNIKG